MLEESSVIVPSIWESIINFFTPTILFILLNLMIATILFTSISPNNHNQEHQQNPPKIARSTSVLQRIKSINFYPYKSQETPTTHFKSNQDFPLDQTLESAATQYIFNQVLEHQETTITNIDNFVSAQTHYQENPIANTHFTFEQNHYQEYQESEETVTQFVFDKTHVGKSINEEETEELQSMDEVYSQLTVRHVARTTSDTMPASGEIPKRLPEKMKKSASMKSSFSHFEEEKIVEARRPATVRERKPKIPEEDDGGEVDAKADDFINKFKHQLKLQRVDSIIRYKETITRGSGK